MAGELDPETQALLRTFLESQRAQAAKGYTLENLANAFLEHKETDSKWKRQHEVRADSQDARLHRHVRRIVAIEKGRDSKPRMRNPEDTGHEFVLEPPKDDPKWLARVLREKAVTIALLVTLLLVSAGTVAFIQAAAHGRPVQTLQP